MDTFLSKLYEESLDKQASADVQALLRSLSVEELAELAGIRKVAVAGPTEPGEPTGTAAAAAKVTQQSVPKKTTPPEEPNVNAETPGITAPSISEKQASVGQRLRGAVRGAVRGGMTGTALGYGAGSVADLANHEDDDLGKQRGSARGAAAGAILGALAGALGAQGGVPGSRGGGKKNLPYYVPPRSKPVEDMAKLNQANFLTMAMHAVAEAPEPVRRMAAKVAAHQMSQIAE